MSKQLETKYKFVTALKILYGLLHICLLLLRTNIKSPDFGGFYFFALYDTIA